MNNYIYRCARVGRRCRKQIGRQHVSIVSHTCCAVYTLVPPYMYITYIRAYIYNTANVYMTCSCLVHACCDVYMPCIHVAYMLIQVCSPCPPRYTHTYANVIIKQDICVAYRRFISLCDTCFARLGFSYIYICVCSIGHTYISLLVYIYMGLMIYHIPCRRAWYPNTSAAVDVLYMMTKYILYL